LLNIEYKIAAKDIANRPKQILNTLINKDQTGFLKGRYIGNKRAQRALERSPESEDF